MKKKIGIAGLVVVASVTGFLGVRQTFMNSMRKFSLSSPALCYPDYYIYDAKQGKNDFGYYCRDEEEILSISLVDKGGTERTLANNVNNNYYQNSFPEDMRAGTYHFKIIDKKGKKEFSESFFIDSKEKRYESRGL